MTVNHRHPSSTRIAPHVLLFAFYNLLYLLPLLIVFLVGYSRGGAEAAVAMDHETLTRIIALYVIGLVSFLVGDALAALGIRGARPEPPPGRVDLKTSDGLVIGGLVAVFCLSKVLLISKGVYQEYAFTGGQMTGGIWSFSMFCSEMLVLVQIIVLGSTTRRNVFWFLALTAVSAINLMHGTRIFFVISLVAGATYAYMLGRISLRRAILLGPVAATLGLLLAYVVFLTRSGAQFEGAFSFAGIISPVVYESLFSQLPLVAVVRSPELWNDVGNATHFFSDVIMSSTPRILLPEKDELQYISEMFARVSPMGAFNGYAAGLVYFGVLFPVFYVALGVVSRLLYSKVASNAWLAIIYVYFCADFLFRVMRDGYIIPVKMLINVLELLFLLILLRALFGKVRERLVTT